MTGPAWGLEESQTQTGSDFYYAIISGRYSQLSAPFDRSTDRSRALLATLFFLHLPSQESYMPLLGLGKLVIGWVSTYEVKIGKNFATAELIHSLCDSCGPVKLITINDKHLLHKTYQQNLEAYTLCTQLRFKNNGRGAINFRQSSLRFAFW